MIAKRSINSNSAEMRLHQDGVIGVASDVPAWANAALGQERVSAGYVLFRSNGIELEFNFIVLGGNGKHPDAMHGTARRTQSRDEDAEFIPGEIRDIEKQGECEQREKGAAENLLRSGHGEGLCLRWEE